MHIDAAMLRIVVDTNTFSPSMIIDTDRALHANLAGDYRPRVYSEDADRLLDDMCAAIILAHEQRHYLDYYLTNYGSWLARFWSQFKQFVPELLANASQILIPARYMVDQLTTSALDMRLPEGYIRNAAVLAWNHSHFVSTDREPELQRYGGLSGSTQLEALATAFEVGPVEEVMDPSGWMVVSRALPRDLATWRRNYAWAAEVFHHFGLGNVLQLADTDGHIADTRTWPAILIGSLMGEFHLLRPKQLAENPDLWDRILPSRRLGLLLQWLSENAQLRRATPTDMWEAVNNACNTLFGADVAESMKREVQATTEMTQQQLEQYRREVGDSPLEVSHEVVEILGHLRERQHLLDRLESDPMSLVDPRVYWGDLSPSGKYIPEYFLVNRKGFSVEAPFQRFTSPFYQAEVESRPVFLKPSVPSRIADLQFHDEIFSALSRFFVRGCLSDSWVGPELEFIFNELVNREGVRIVPPYNVPG